MGLFDDLTAGAAAGRSVLHCWSDSDYVTTPWREVSAEAERMTHGLRDAGVRPGATVASILTNTPLAVRGILATWLAGGTLASLPVPARGMTIETYLRQLETMCGMIDPVTLMVDESMLALLPEDFRERVGTRSWESVADSGRVEPEPPDEDEVAFIQFSSGSTSVPKGCMLTPRAIDAQLAMIIEMVGAERHKGCDVSWLPLSHDMGIFGNMLTLWAYDMDLVLSPPERFMMQPRSWFEDVSRFGATFTCSTNTGLHLAARRQGSRKLPKQLALRTIILGAERIERRTLDLALSVFGPYGLHPEVFMPAYGLAEATLAVTATPKEEPPRSIVVDGVRLADGMVEEVAADHPAGTAIVSGGRPVTGVELPGMRSDRLCEVAVKSPSLAVGYAGDPARTAERFVDGAFHTGDLGFMRDGYFYPVGRSDDVIQVGGRNVYAREIEAAVDDIDGVRRGCSTIVDVEDERQELVLLLELADGFEIDPKELAEQAACVAMEKAAVPLDRCLLLARGALPKTPSGKIQRYRCRRLLLDGQLEPEADVVLSGVAAGGP